MKYFLLFLILFISSLNLSAYEHQFQIINTTNDDEIEIESLDKNLEINQNDVFVIFSQTNEKVLGYAKATISPTSNQKWLLKVQTHNKNGIIRIGNYLQKIDLSNSNSNFPGRYDLVIESKKNIAVKYRPLVYAGMFNGMTANNLSEKEFLIGLSVIGYGLTNNWQVSTNLGASYVRVFNASLKNKTFENDDFTFSIEGGAFYYQESNKTSFQLNLNLDSNTNSSFKNYTKLKIFTKKPKDNFLIISEKYDKNFNIELAYAYGYIFENWNRIIFGPKVDVNQKKFGGNLYYYIEKEVVTYMIGVTTNDFSEYIIGKTGYIVNVDIWWRF